MDSVNRSKYRFSIILGAVVLLCLLYYNAVGEPASQLSTRTVEGLQSLGKQYTVWKPFIPTPRKNHEWYKSQCFLGAFSEDIESFVLVELPTWSSSDIPECKELYNRFSILYNIKHRPIDDIENISHGKQNNSVIHVSSPLTFEHAVYNVEATRTPKVIDSDIFKWVDKVSNETAKNCDFCSVNTQTAIDEFGRSENSSSARLSNTFKLEKWHTIVVTRTHHPTNISKDAFIRLLESTLPWIRMVAAKDPDYIFPNMIWDTLHHAGASQMHPHIQIMVSPDHYYGFAEQLRSAAQSYHNHVDENYFNDVLETHEALGLVTHYHDAVAISIITGKTDLEVLLLSYTPGEALYKLLYYTITTLHQNFYEPCHSVGMAWPPVVGGQRAAQARIPAIIRVAARGDCDSTVSDFTARELYQIVLRKYSPWEIAHSIRNTITKEEKGS
ncbi:unnamed protein product [Meganyctiphanes norvegica]|uniref:Galactose-1-phosphate uridylyltransferase n=1 Tax=Meganyctiphanes norvegica TaxID=48144 RepID=A0AAV2Q852_MEGNR